MAHVLLIQYVCHLFLLEIKPQKTEIKPVLV